MPSTFFFSCKLFFHPRGGGERGLTAEARRARRESEEEEFAANLRGDCARRTRAAAFHFFLSDPRHPRSSAAKKISRFSPRTLRLRGESSSERP
jgi:hypothetical protein